MANAQILTKGISGFFRIFGKTIGGVFKPLGWFLGLLFTGGNKRWSWSVLFAIVILISSVVLAVEQEGNLGDKITFVIKDIVLDRIIGGDAKLEQSLIDEPLVFEVSDGNLWDKIKASGSFALRVLIIFSQIWMYLIVWLLIIYNFVSLKNKSEVQGNMEKTFLIFAITILISQIVLTMQGYIELRIPGTGLFEFFKQLVGISPEIRNLIDTTEVINQTNQSIINITNRSVI